MPFTQDMYDSHHDFALMIKTVLPQIREHLSSQYEYFQVEGDPHPLLQALDQYSGIDGFLTSTTKQLYGLAARVQWTEKSWSTFTIRYGRVHGGKTEFEKRIEALKSQGEYLFPAYTVQAYLKKRGETNPHILGFGLINTKELYRHTLRYFSVYEKEMKTRQIKKPQSNPFLAIPWKHLREWSKLCPPVFVMYPDDCHNRELE